MKPTLHRADVSTTCFLLTRHDLPSESDAGQDDDFQARISCLAGRSSSCLCCSTIEASVRLKEAAVEKRRRAVDGTAITQAVR